MPAGPLSGETENDPEGGPPGTLGSTVTCVTPVAPPPRPSATAATYCTSDVRATRGAVSTAVDPVGAGKIRVSAQLTRLPGSDDATTRSSLVRRGSPSG